ncbi:MAG: XRE family transcriptional regulator [Candidatus Tectomicrobia bacterium]|uniref:XRE family transcriptional regulator n=1 Tax=Tectimicrobiota bacterium TaxID=2528274 RepID=A0A932HYK0_UNCTE|nr:XRE family transcriptional regulator [Candidatus Tectomicrobia bacterium]
MSKKTHIGSSFEGFLAEEGILEETETIAIKRVIAWQIKQAMEKKRISKAEMAQRMRTSRPVVDRLLDPTHKSLTLSTLVKAAIALDGKAQVSIDVKSKRASA